MPHPDGEPLSLGERHGARRLPAVTVDSYNLELRDQKGFVGDHANKRAFGELLEGMRRRLRAVGDDPLGDIPTDEIQKKHLDELLDHGDPEAAGVIHAAVEAFAHELADVVRRFLQLDAWRGVERIAVGGGFRERHFGELAIGRAAVILKADGLRIDLRPIRHHPDEAGLIGSAFLVPTQSLAGYDGVLAVDIGGTNMRCGIVRLHLKKTSDLSKAKVSKMERWRHADEEPGRDEAVERLADLLNGMIERAGKKDLRLAPFIGIGCPGAIREDGSIARGAQNLPGDWESDDFNLPDRLKEKLERTDDVPLGVILHNDAVVQGLSELPFMRDVSRWAILTIGTGLGNASFTNRDTL